jgi:hypothetical protein
MQDKKHTVNGSTPIAPDPATPKSKQRIFQQLKICKAGYRAQNAGKVNNSLASFSKTDRKGELNFQFDFHFVRQNRLYVNQQGCLFLPCLRTSDVVRLTTMPHA